MNSENDMDNAVISGDTQQELTDGSLPHLLLESVTSDEVGHKIVSWTMRFTLGITQGIVSAPEVLYTSQGSGKLVSSEREYTGKPLTNVE